MKEYAYGRVSSKDQNLDRQLDLFRKIPIKEENIYLDKMSGKNFARKNYRKLLRKLKPGDALYILEIKRLGRDYKEIIEQWKIITQEKKADIIVLNMPLLDTRREKDLLGTFISDLVLQILSFCAESDRKDIKNAQAQGIKSAKARGVKFGRPRKITPEEFKQHYFNGKKQGRTDGQLMDELDISATTFYRYLKELKH